MKKIYTSLLLFATLFSFMACDFLDIVPDERTKEEDAYTDVQAGLRYLYSCYSFLPNPREGTASLDLMTGDEVITGFDHEVFAQFPRGNFNASNTVISYWETLYGGIRQSWMFMNNMDRIPGIEEYKSDWQGQLHFLIAYYHLLLMRCYGPICLVKDIPDVNVDRSEYTPRSTMAETVQFICDEFDAAVACGIPARREGTEVGLATSVAAKALKAYTLMYYASPLHNGGNDDFAKQVTDPDGNVLMSLGYDASRWETARKAYKEAIDAAEAAGYRLFDTESQTITNTKPESELLRVLRLNLVTSEANNDEEIWTRAGDEGISGLQKKSMPFVDRQYWNGVGPTYAMLQRFYTKNGLPWDVDPETKDLDPFQGVTLNEQNAYITFRDDNSTNVQIAATSGQTSLINLNREPRYYAWVAFHNGFYEVRNATYQGAYTDAKWQYDDGRVTTQFLRYDVCGMQDRTNNNHAPSGFLNKKGVHPDNEGITGNYKIQNYTWPIVRLAELYLGYSECAAECGMLGDEGGENPGAQYYLNMVRHRAGIPDVATSWASTGININTVEQMRSIVRQERQVELYLENQNFWDMRRWLLAEKYFNAPWYGMNKYATTFIEFSQKTEVTDSSHPRIFQWFHYLLPIPSYDANNNPNIKQNPGY